VLQYFAFVLSQTTTHQHCTLTCPSLTLHNLSTDSVTQYALIQNQNSCGEHHYYWYSRTVVQWYTLTHCCYSRCAIANTRSRSAVSWSCSSGGPSRQDSSVHSPRRSTPPLSLACCNNQLHYIACCLQYAGDWSLVTGPHQYSH
jgi:hypothetical protein